MIQHLLKSIFVLSFQNEEDRASFSNYNVPKVEIKDFSVLIDVKRFFDVPVKSKEETYEKIRSVIKTTITQLAFD